MSTGILFCPLPLTFYKTVTTKASDEEGNYKNSDSGGCAGHETLSIQIYFSLGFLLLPIAIFDYFGSLSVTFYKKIT